jgi:hypothetical protein
MLLRWVGGSEVRRKLHARAIRTFIDGWNDRCQPFAWTKTADEIVPHATRRRDRDARH